MNRAFQAWFGDSKVVDEDGQPLVVYHGKRGPQPRVFKAYGNIGSYFTPDKSLAMQYAGLVAMYGGKARKGGTVGSYYLRIVNPLMWNPETDDKVCEWLRENYLLGDRSLDEHLEGYVDFLRHNKEYEYLSPDLDGLTETIFNLCQEGVQPDWREYDPLASLIREFAMDLGHDGIIRPYSGGGLEYIAFTPEQVKSTVDNDGTWDADDPDIRSNPGPAFIRFEHKNGLGLMNRTGFDAMRLTDDEDFELTELLTYGLRQPVEVSRGAVFAFTPEGVQKNARLIKLLRKASITGVKKITLDPEAYRVVWQSDDGQVALVPASLGIGPGGREARLYEPA